MSSNGSSNNKRAASSNNKTSQQQKKAKTLKQGTLFSFFSKKPAHFNEGFLKKKKIIPLPISLLDSTVDSKIVIISSFSKFLSLILFADASILASNNGYWYVGVFDYK